jgi:hypothetical protein
VTDKIGSSGSGAANQSSGRIRYYIVAIPQRQRNHEQVAGAIRKIMSEERNVTSNAPALRPVKGNPCARLFAARISTACCRFPRSGGAVREYPDGGRDPTLNLNTPELQLKAIASAPDLGAYGDIASTVRLMFSGQDEISTFKEGSNSIQSAFAGQRDNPDMLARLMVPSSKSGRCTGKPGYHSPRGRLVLQLQPPVPDFGGRQPRARYTIGQRRRLPARPFRK